MLKKGMHLSSRPKRQSSILKQYKQPIKLKPSNFAITQTPLQISSDFNNISCRTIISIPPPNHSHKQSSLHCQPEHQTRTLRSRVQQLSQIVQYSKESIKQMKTIKQNVIAMQAKQYNEIMEQIRLLEKQYREEKGPDRKLKHYGCMEEDLADIENRIQNMINM